MRSTSDLERTGSDTGDFLPLSLPGIVPKPMCRRGVLRACVLVAIFSLAGLLIYSQRNGVRPKEPPFTWVRGDSHQNRRPLEHTPARVTPAPQDISRVSPRVGQRGSSGPAPKGVKPKLVGEDWEKKDTKRLPDIALLNLDDPSLPRRPGAPPGETGAYSALEQLIPGLVPSIIHFTWCGKRLFEFKYYLAVLSVIRFVRPDKIVMHMEYEPFEDKLHYNQWMADLTHDFPFLHVAPLQGSERTFCYGTRETKMRVILGMLGEEGGMYVGENTWLLDFPARNRDVDLDLAFEPSGTDGYVILRGGLVSQHSNLSLEAILGQMERTGRYRTKRHQCAPVRQIYHGNKHPHCLIVKGDPFDRFYPTHIWGLADPFGNIARRIFYGTEEILKPKPSYDTLVPNIGHMIWVGGGPMDFVFYLSLLSMLYVVNVDRVYVHGDVPPKGPYWHMLLENPKAAPRIKFVARPQPLLVYQGVIEGYYKALMSDIIRVDIMIKYGGIYADTDAIWVKPLSYEDRGYDAVASFDWVDWSYPYPDSVNFGLSYGKRNAPFWRIFRNSMRKLHNEVHGFTGVMMPYKLLEKYPHLLRIDRHLQVICYHFRCHPTWVPGYHNMSIDHVTTGSLDNWREVVNAFHWTHPNPKEYANETTLLASTGLFADIGKMVLRKAGLL